MSWRQFQRTRSPRKTSRLLSYKWALIFYHYWEDSVVLKEPATCRYWPRRTCSPMIPNWFALTVHVIYVYMWMHHTYRLSLIIPLQLRIHFCQKQKSVMGKKLFFYMWCFIIHKIWGTWFHKSQNHTCSIYIHDLFLHCRNLLSVNVHSVYSVPDSWQPGGYPYTFTVALPMPIAEDVRISVMYIWYTVCSNFPWSSIYTKYITVSFLW